MKRVICYQAESGAVYTEDSTTSTMIGFAEIGAMKEAPQSDNETLIKLVGSGMSSEDIIKLKHGGVL